MGCHLCVVSDCDRTVRASGYCGRHYQAWRAYGDPLGKTARKRSDPLCDTNIPWVIRVDGQPVTLSAVIRQPRPGETSRADYTVNVDRGAVGVVFRDRGETRYTRWSHDEQTWYSRAGVVVLGPYLDLITALRSLLSPVERTN